MAYIYSPWKRIEAKSGSTNAHEKNAYGYVCEITLDGTGDGTAHATDLNTPPFDFPVNSDFTVIANADATDLNTVNLDVMAIQGSANGTTYADMSTLNASAIDSKSVHFIHDITTHGVMPYMRFHSDGFSGTISGSFPVSFKIMIIPHVT